MELIKQRLLNIKLVLGLLTLVNFISCQMEENKGKLECILDGVNIDTKGMIIEVGQANGWTDSTVLLLITYHKKSEEELISCNLKGDYKGNNIYFNQGNIDTMDKRVYIQISNNIKWNNHIPHEMDEDYISPPYDPINIQLEYTLEKNCIIEIIRGKGYFNLKTISKCMCNS
ncbi:MAG TPA: hypothetical protein PKD85_22855 [Saprospiraceae bacterium]|nr:hypothetical protein [Saprospiraceae bacterium]